MNPNNPEKRLPIADLAVFVAVAEALGFTAGARRLGVSKAMVSVAIGRLETRLGVRLFQRTTRRLSLTEAGVDALPHAQRALAAARDAEEAARQTQAGPRGKLRVSVPMSFGLLHLVPALAEFAALYPAVSVDLALDDRVVDLVEGGFDLAIRIGTLADSSLIAKRLGKSRNVLVAAPSYLAKHRAPKRPLDLRSHAALVYSLSSTGSRWTFTRGARKETVSVSGPLRASSSLALHRAIGLGLGIGRLPTFIAGADLASGRLVEVLPEWKLADQGIYAVTTTRDYLPKKTQAFIEFFQARLGEPPYWEPRGRAGPAAPQDPKVKRHVSSAV
ncbi:MAG: LysR family transcriptional regulator [Myxococcales bacterium]|nr:LysR family transcriptional regulator [Myxococcales bacterium]